MPYSWDYCKTCGKEFSDGESNKKEFRDCKRCQIIKRVILSCTVFLIILILFLGAYFCTRHWAGLIGLIFGIIGAYLLATGYLETLVQAGAGAGGGGDIIRDFKKRHSRRIWVGLIFLVLGFFLQAINSL